MNESPRWGRTESHCSSLGGLPDKNATYPFLLDGLELCDPRLKPGTSTPSRRSARDRARSGPLWLTRAPPRSSCPRQESNLRPAASLTFKGAYARRHSGRGPGKELRGGESWRPRRRSRRSQNRPRPRSRRPSPVRRSKPFQALPGPRRRTGEGSRRWPPNLGPVARRKRKIKTEGRRSKRSRRG